MSDLNPLNLTPPFTLETGPSQPAPAGGGAGAILPYLAMRGRLNHPFLGPTVPAELKGFVDLDLRYDVNALPAAARPNAADADLPVVLTNATLGNDAATCSLTLKFSSGETLIATGSSTLLESRSWGHWVMHRWRYTGDDYEVLLTVVLDAELYPSGYSGTPDLTIAGALCRVRPRQLVAIRVVDDEAVEHVCIGTPTLQVGYNVEMELAGPEEGTPPVSTLTLGVEPGAGLGRIPGDGCEEEVVLRTINGVTGDADGNITLNPKDCYWLERPVDLGETPPEGYVREGTVAAATLAFRNDCAPCIDCGEYSSAYAKLRTIWQRATNVKERLDIAKDYYLDILARVKSLQQMLSDRILTFNVYKSVDSQDAIVQVKLKCGERRFSGITLTLTTPAGYTTTYVDGSGWEQLPGRTARQDNVNFSANGKVYTSAAYFPAGSVCWWQWSLKLGVNTVPVAAGAENLSQISLTATMDEIASDGAATEVEFGPLTRKPKVTE